MNSFGTIFENKADFFISKLRISLLKMLNRTENQNKKHKLPICLLIRHQQNPFIDVKRASSKKIKGWGMELRYSLLSKMPLFL